MQRELKGGCEFLPQAIMPVSHLFPSDKDKDPDTPHYEEKDQERNMI